MKISGDSDFNGELVVMKLWKYAAGVMVILKKENEIH